MCSNVEDQKSRQEDLASQLDAQVTDTCIAKLQIHGCSNTLVHSCGLLCTRILIKHFYEMRRV